MRLREQDFYYATIHREDLRLGRRSMVVKHILQAFRTHFPRCAELVPAGVSYFEAVMIALVNLLYPADDLLTAGRVTRNSEFDVMGGSAAPFQPDPELLAACEGLKTLVSPGMCAPEPV